MRILRANFFGACSFQLRLLVDVDPIGKSYFSDSLQHIYVKFSHDFIGRYRYSIFILDTNVRIQIQKENTIYLEDKRRCIYAIFFFFEKK
jgi:hypothetical protein